MVLAILTYLGSKEENGRECYRHDSGQEDCVGESKARAGRFGCYHHKEKPPSSERPAHCREPRPNPRVGLADVVPCNPVRAAVNRTGGKESHSVDGEVRSGVVTPVPSIHYVKRRGAIPPQRRRTYDQKGHANSHGQNGTWEENAYGNIGSGDK